MTKSPMTFFLIEKAKGTCVQTAVNHRVFASLSTVKIETTTSTVETSCLASFDRKR
jgi:hypothetical protein